MIAVLVLGAVGTALLLAFVVVPPGPDDVEVDDGYYYVDDPSVSQAVEKPCARVDELARASRPFGAGSAGSSAIGDLAGAHRAVADAIGEADAGDDADAMAADWRAIGEALDRYADALESDASKAAFEMPTVHGEAAASRIYWGNEACYVPNLVLGLDPDANLFS